MTFAYGPAAMMDGLANTRVDGTNGYVSLRFVASVSEALNSIRYFHQFTGGAGYGAGTGGTWDVTIEADNGSGYPDGTPLATASLAALASNSLGRLVTFGSPPTLVAGNRYHVVFHNTDATPASNYASVNCMWKHDSTPPDPMAPRYANADWGVTYFDTAWHNRGFTAVLQLNWATSGAEGIGYVELAYTAGHYVQIDNTNWARHQFTPTQDLDISAVGFRAVVATGGTQDMTVSIEVNGGAEIASTLLPVASFAVGTSASYDTGAPAGMDWVEAAITASLTAGVTYNIIFKVAAAGSTFYTFPIRRGDVFFSFDPVTVFKDGNVAEKSSTSGASWSNCTANSGSADVDLQTYMMAAVRAAAAYASEHWASLVMRRK